MRPSRVSVVAAVSAALLVGSPVVTPPVSAQSGLSDERLSLPDGPGSIGGVGENVGVDPNMGAASFSVPIRVPQADARMTPQVGLAYASGAGMGIAGIGWDLSVGSIERMTARGLPTYTTADAFVADGSDELVFVGNLDGTRVYRARFEGGFVRYRWHSVGAGAAGYWTAELPDGRISYYGADATGALVANARVQGTGGETFRYELVETVDPDGRRIVHRYLRDGGWPRLDEISYGYGGMATPRFSVRFAYEPRPDVMSDASPGYEIQLTQRLTEVRVLSEAEVIRRYALAYEAENVSGGMSRLARVTEFGRDGGTLPIEHSFRYSRSLSGTCEVGCERPFVVDMGTLPGGVSIQTGRAALVDINGDSLPDVLSSSDTGVHTFHISRLSTEGRPGFTGAAVTSAATTGGSAFVLSAPGVQLLDVNGDGFTDVVSQVTGTVLCNTGSGDWAGSACAADASTLPTLADDAGDPASEPDPLGMRFFDFDNDKRIDLLRTPDASQTFVSRNTGTAYATVPVDPIGAAFDAEELQLADLNGDGLQDPAMLVDASATSTTLRYRIHLGFGRWGAWATVTLTDLSPAQADDAVLQDLDGDGLDDIVVVQGSEVRYWRNRNAGRFAPVTVIGAGAVDGTIPARTSSETVVFADMNGNGTDDVVWISDTGRVRFLELFPVRPNLLARVENGIGWVRVIEYGTSIAERARDVGTPREWEHPLPTAMTVVRATDDWVTLTADDTTGVHERSELSYHSGYYDGVEKGFRGFELVDRRRVTDAARDGQEPLLEQLEYDVGRNDRYHRGLLVRAATRGGAGMDVPLREARNEFADCPLTGVGATTPAVRFVCPVAETVVHQEGAPASQWLTVRTEREHDGFGNVTVLRQLGVVGTGADGTGACGACDAPAGLSSGACGASCTGDERVTRTTYVPQGTGTGGAWLLRLVAQTEVSDAESAPGRIERRYYDGPDFVGLAAGQATRGRLTRVERVLAAGESVHPERYAYDALGNVSVMLGANGSETDPTHHRREYTYDARGLRVTEVRWRAGDYDIVQSATYESSFLQVSEATSPRVVRGGTDVTPRNPMAYAYDEFGRLSALAVPGDTRAAPTRAITYELGDPVTRIVVDERSVPGGPVDGQRVVCQDGRGRTVQTRVRVADGRWAVDGFVERNARGEQLRVFQPYEGTSGACEPSPPSGVAFARHVHDALGRRVSSTAPDAALHGGVASVTRTEHGPLRRIEHDAEDTAAAEGAPTAFVSDGLERLVRVERRLDAATSATYGLFYDAVGDLVRVEDPDGNAHVQSYDGAGRVVAIDDPSAGVTSIERDAAGNEVRRVDARGRAVRSVYDAMDRLAERWHEADRAGTLETNEYDASDACAECGNGAGRLVRSTYPLPSSDAPGVDEIGYDARGHRSFLRRTLESIAFETSWVRDSEGNVLEATYPDGQTLTWEYDGATRPIGIDGIASAGEYDARGQLAGYELANGVRASFEHDAMMRPSGIEFAGPSGTVLGLAVTRNRVGNIVEQEDTSDRPLQGARYAYDGWHRVVEAVLASSGAAEETVSVDYDLLDRITARTSSHGAASPAHVGSYTYDPAAPQIATQVGGTGYTHDEAGRVTARGTTQLDWDHLGRLAQATPDGGLTTEIAYAPSGERVLKLEEGGVTYYAAPDFEVRDGISAVSARLGDRTLARRRTATLATVVLADSNGDDRIDVADAWSAQAGGEGEGAVLRRLRASARRLLHDARDATTFLHADFRGSAVVATDEQGAVIGARRYDLFGAQRDEEGFVDARHGFTGHELDETTGLLHAQERYLDPVSGRWTASDPAFEVLDVARVRALGESTATYAYVANDPVNDVDPTGRGRAVRRFFAGIYRAFRRGGVNDGIRQKIQAKSEITRRDHRELRVERDQAQARLGRAQAWSDSLGSGSDEGPARIGQHRAVHAAREEAAAELREARSAYNTAYERYHQARTEQTEGWGVGVAALGIGTILAGSIVGAIVAAVRGSLGSADDDGDADFQDLF